MDESQSFLDSLSAGGSGDVEPHLPYLLQDLSALGGSPDTAIALLESAGVVPGEGDVVLDLGCGKGATLIALAGRFGCGGRGVDLMSEFIDEANILAHEHSVADRVTFEVADMREVVARDNKHVWIVYGHDAAIFGDLPATLRVLRSALVPGGRLVLDATCRKPGASDEAEELPLQTEIGALFRAAGFDEIARRVIPAAEVHAENERNTAAISRRAAELKEKHPDIAHVFDEYVEEQREECAFLENDCESPYFLLQAI